MFQQIDASRGSYAYTTMYVHCTLPTSPRHSSFVVLSKMSPYPSVLVHPPSIKLIHGYTIEADSVGGGCGGGLGGGSVRIAVSSACRRLRASSSTFGLPSHPAASCHCCE